VNHQESEAYTEQKSNLLWSERAARCIHTLMALIAILLASCMTERFHKLNEHECCQIDKETYVTCAASLA
jgi:hypothetical protein